MAAYAILVSPGNRNRAAFRGVSTAQCPVCHYLPQGSASRKAPLTRSWKSRFLGSFTFEVRPIERSDGRHRIPHIVSNESSVLQNPASQNSADASDGAQLGFIQEFELLLRARYPVIYVPTREEERLENTIRQIARMSNQRAVYIWDFVEGYQGSKNDEGFAKRNPLQALDLLDKVPPNAPAIFILRDYSRFLADVSVSRRLRNMVRALKGSPKNIVILAPEVDIPLELRETITVCEFPLPNASDVRREVERVITALGQSKAATDEQVIEQLVRSCQGLSLDRIRRVLSRAVATHGQLRVDDLDMIIEEKRQLIRQTQILDYYHTSEELDDIGGLDNLKEWLLRRQNAFSDQARQYGLPYPRGLLLAGVQGTGKSLTCKAVAHQWRLPLLRLDVGRLFGGVVGESESRTRQMVQTAEALAPCVVWIDEIDKAFADRGRQGDGGTAARVFGTLLTWLGEKTSPVFVVATANNVQALPPELLRKGRFDEIFFIGLPTESERRSIFEVHLRRLRPDSFATFDMLRLARDTIAFSGAEIEQVIVEAMHTGFSQGREFTTQDILEAASQMVPLARTAREQVEELERWATSGRARTASRRVTLTTNSSPPPPASASDNNQ